MSSKDVIARLLRQPMTWVKRLEMSAPPEARQAGKDKALREDGSKVETSLKSNPGFCPICARIF